MPGPVQVTLDEALTAPESGRRLAHRGLELTRDVLDRPGDLQPAAPAAERGLNRDRQPVLGGELDDLRDTAHGSVSASGKRRANLTGDVPGGHLVAERLDGRRRWSDPRQAGVQ